MKETFMYKIPWINKYNNDESNKEWFNLAFIFREKFICYRTSIKNETVNDFKNHFFHDFTLIFVVIRCRPAARGFASYTRRIYYLNKVWTSVGIATQRDTKFCTFDIIGWPRASSCFLTHWWCYHKNLQILLIQTNLNCFFKHLKI